MATEIRCRKCGLHVVPAVEPGMPWMHRASQVTWCDLPAGPFGSCMADPDLGHVEAPGGIVAGVPVGRPLWVAYAADGRRLGWTAGPLTPANFTDEDRLAMAELGEVTRWELEG